MDGWVPKGGGGGALPPGDGAFERFLTAAIAAIITIMFSWRLLDDMSEDSNKGVGDDEEGRRRRATAYAALALTSSHPSQPPPRPPITDLDIDEGVNYYYGDDDDDKRARDEGLSSAPRSYDSGYQSVLWSGGIGATVSRSDSSSVDGLEETDFSSLDMMKCFTSAPPVYLPTPENNNYHTYLPGSTDSPSRELSSDREGESPRMEAPLTSSDDSSRDLSDSDREMQKDGTTCVDWPPENADDFYNVSGDSDDVQPRELDSDEELYCCSLLEPIIEEDSDDFLSSSGDSNSLQPSIPPPPLPRPPLPANHPPLSSSTFARRFATNEGSVGDSAVRSPATVVEVGQLSKASPQAVLEDVFNPTSPLIPADRGHHSSRHSPDNADDSESDESVQTVIRRGSVPSSGEGSVDSSPLHGPSFFPTTAPDSPVCEKRLSSPKRYGGVRPLAADIDPGKATYPETTDEVLYSVYEANHPVLYGDDSWRDGCSGVKRRSDWTEGGRNSSDEDDNDSTIDNISHSEAGIERGDGEVGSDTNTPVSAPLSAAWVSTTSQPQAPAVFTSELSYPVSTQKDTSLRNPVVSDTHRESFSEGACVETDLDGLITELSAEPVRRDRDPETDTNMERRGKSGAIDSFLTEFEDEPFARRRGRRDRSPKRDTFVGKLKRRETDTRPTPHPMTDTNTRVDSLPDRHVGPDPKITDLDDEPVFRTRRTSDRRTENPSKQSHHPTRGELETDIDSDMGDRGRESKPRDPFLVELDEEPFARRWGSGRKSVPVETERRDPTPRKTDDRQSLPLKIEATYSAPIESVMPQDYNSKKPAHRETYARKSPQMETDIDGDDSYSDTRGRDTDRDRRVQRGTDSFMTDLEGEPVVRRVPTAVRSPEDDSLNRSRRSDSGSHRSPDDSYSDRRATHYGKREKDLESDNRDPYKRGRYDPDLEIDLYKNNQRDSDLDTQSFHSARSETDLDRSVGKKSDKSIDSFLTELDEEPFARRIGRRRGASPERARDREKPRPVFQTAPSFEPGPVLSSPTATCPVLELSPTVSQPTFSPQTKPVSPENMVMVSDSPSISMPTAIPSTQGDTRITSTPQKPEKGAQVAVPESPTISMPPAMEAFPQVRMSYSTTSRIGTSAVLPPPAPPAAAAVEEPPSSGPFADAAESNAVEPTPRGYTFTRCESESIRSERRMFLVDKPLAPDFESFINSVPFSSETYAELEDEGSNDFDEYSNFVQNLHRPSCSGAELSAALPLKSPAVDERCILSGNLVSPPNVDVFQFPQAHSTMPTVSSEAYMHRSDSADVGSDSYKAEASSDVLDTSFDIDNTEVREKMETDFAFLQDGNTVRLPPTREEDSSKEPRDYGAETSSQQTSEADGQADTSSDRSVDREDRRDDRRRKRDYSSSRDSDRKRRKSGNEDWSDDDIPYADDPKIGVDIEKRTRDIYNNKLTIDSATPGLGERRDEVGRQRKEEQERTPERRDYPGRDKMTSERASDIYSRPDSTSNKLPVQPQSTTRLEDAPTILFFQPASSIHQDKTQSPKDHTATAQPQTSPYSERQEDTRKVDPFPFKREPPRFDSFSKPGERGETIFMPAQDSSPKGPEKYSPDSRDSENREDSYDDKDENKDRGDIVRREEVPKLELSRKEAIENDRRRFFLDISPRTEVSPRIKVSPRMEDSPRTGESSLTEVSPCTGVSPRTEVSPFTEVSPHTEVSPRTEGSPRIEVSPEAESSPRTNYLTDSTNFGPYWEKPPIPKPRVMARPTPMPRSKSLGDNIGSPSLHGTGIADDEDVFHGEASDSDTDSHPSLQDDEEEELLFKPQKSASLAAEEKRPRSLKEIRRIQKSGTRPMIAPFTLPDHIILPSRLKIMASRRQFLSSENLDSSPNTSLQEQFAAHKVSQQQTKERRYKSPNKKFSSPSFSSQDQLEKLNYMLNYSRQSESSFDRSLIDHLHEGCILTPEGRRSILDKTMSIENLQVDLPSHLRRFGSVTSLVETDIDTGETLETNFFPETNLDIFDHLFQSHQPLQRSASMSDLLLNDQRGAEHGHEYGSGGRGLSLGLPSQTHKSTGKGRFAHRKHQKSKSLCTLETNLDEVGEEGEDPALRRVPSVHELRVTKSLQKLNVPDWFKQSSLSKSSSCLLKYGSSSTMNSFSFSPSLISSPCASTAPPAPNVVIKTRVVPPSNPRALRSPNFSSSTAIPSSDRKPPAVPVKLPSEKLREKEKNKNLMPIPIVPFAQIRAMFEKKGKGQEQKKEAATREAEKTREERKDTKPKVEKAPTVVSRPAVPSISISSEEEVAVAPKEARPTSAKRTLFDKPPISPTRTSPPVAEETFIVTTSSPISAQPQQSVPRPGHRATNGVSEDLDGHFVSPSTVSPRTEVFPPSSSTGRSHPVTERPPISPTSAEPKTPWRDSKDSSVKNAPKDSPKDAQPKSPPKDSKQQFSPSRSLRQFFGRSKDKSSSEKKSEGGSSLDSSFSSGDDYYEKEPRRIGGSERSRRFDSNPAGSTSFEGREPRSDHDSSFSSEGLPSGVDTSSRSLEGAPPRSSRAPQSSATFPASVGSRPTHANSERHQPPYSRFGPQEDSEPPPRSSRTSKGSDRTEPGGAPTSYQRRLPGAGTSYGHLSSSSENGEHVPESVSPASSRPESVTAAEEKKSVKETTV